MADRLGTRVTAKGVATIEQAGLLKHMDYDSLKGYFFSKPFRRRRFLACRAGAGRSASR